MQRRHFLSGILAAGIAPAVLSQGSAMRLWVPKHLRFGAVEIDYTADQIILMEHKDGFFDAKFIDPHGTRGFITGVPWAPRKVIYNEHWMLPNVPYPT